ncbi:hypothetical protein SDC9_183364 [bioreactor metagenome]|uniref:Uncharacterized protein n=1 Tax=bioreactor metagenome TaxID=1076179 RepID=A0A645HBX0_9ZZZZ
MVIVHSIPVRRREPKVHPRSRAAPLNRAVRMHLLLFSLLCRTIRHSRNRPPSNPCHGRQSTRVQLGQGRQRAKIRASAIRRPGRVPSRSEHAGQRPMYGKCSPAWQEWPQPPPYVKSVREAAVHPAQQEWAHPVCARSPVDRRKVMALRHLRPREAALPNLLSSLPTRVA